jgi:MFS family permease
MEQDLPATSSQYSWSLSAFILVQGLMPLVWASISDVKGRKVYILQDSVEILILHRTAGVPRLSLSVYCRDYCRSREPWHRTVSMCILIKPLSDNFFMDRVIGFRVVQAAGQVNYV